MLKAIVSQGVIHPLEPLPADWQEGQELRIEKAGGSNLSSDEIDRDFAVLTRMCETSQSADETELEHALAQARNQAKELVKRQMGQR